MSNKEHIYRNIYIPLLYFTISKTFALLSFNRKLRGSFLVSKEEIWKCATISIFTILKYGLMLVSDTFIFNFRFISCQISMNCTVQCLSWNSLDPLFYTSPSSYHRPCHFSLKFSLIKSVWLLAGFSCCQTVTEKYFQVWGWWEHSEKQLMEVGESLLCQCQDL